MSTAFIKDVLNQAAQVGCRDVRFTGGEPLLRQDFQEVYSHAHEVGMQVSVASNGTCFGPRIVKFLCRCPPHVLSLSMYGWDEESYGVVTGNPLAFSWFVSGVKRLLKAGIKFHLKYPAIPVLLQNRSMLHHFAHHLGYKGHFPYVWELTLHAWRDANACDRIRNLRLSIAEAARQRIRDPGCAFADFKRTRCGLKPRGTNLFRCRSVRVNKRFALNCYGSLQICLEVRHPLALCDLHTHRLNDALMELVTKIDTMEVSQDYMARCGCCVLRPMCNHCPAVSWADNGTLDMPSEYFCGVMHSSAERIGLLKPGEKAWQLRTVHTPRKPQHLIRIYWPLFIEGVTSILDHVKKLTTRANRVK